jgi:hypothetical protein
MNTNDPRSSPTTISLSVPLKCWVISRASVSTRAAMDYLQQLNRQFGGDDMDMLANEWDIAELIAAGFSEADLTGLEVPEDNKPIDEDGMKETENECPKCGFKW